MAAFLYRVGAWSFRAKWFVIVTWLVVLAAVGGAAAAFQAGFNDLFTINKHSGEDGDGDLSGKLS